MPAFEVLPYSLENFQKVLLEKSHGGSGGHTKAHLTYLDAYLKTIGAASFVIENDYIDRDYLEDYAAYYSRCFSEYKRTCTRVHFFSTELTPEQFSSIIFDKNSDYSCLQENYCGFIVIKPLPSTIIGRTCLKNYSDKDKERFFLCNQIYHVNLFGIRLEISSLAFQEQDTDVAACATSALWSSFHATGHIFQHYIPSPIEITNAAASIVRTSNRTIPNNGGLSPEQMADAIRSVSLEPHAIKTGERESLDCNIDLFRSSAYAYLRCGIPCVACGSLYKIDKGEKFGNHAITLNGFRYGSIPSSPSQMPLTRATRLERIYAHDDAVGPFCRLQFDATRGPIITSWPCPNPPGNIGFQPHVLIVPTYHKIRIPFATAYMDMFHIDGVLRNALTPFKCKGKSVVPEWDIYLSKSTDLKSEIRLLPPTRFDNDLQTTPLPRYVWVSDLYINEKLFAKFIFDATDLLQGSRFISCICYDNSVGIILSTISKHSSHIAHALPPVTSAIFSWFSSSFPV